MFDNGSMVASAAATGTVTQVPFETVIFPGVSPLGWPGNNPGLSSFGYVDGYFDSLRISNTARYTANFTKPSAKLASDANALLVINFPTTAPVGRSKAPPTFSPAAAPSNIMHSSRSRSATT